MAKKSISARGFARKVAHEEGIKPISNFDLESVIWARTGYPRFWNGDPISTFESQLRQAFQDVKSGESKNWDPL